MQFANICLCAKAERLPRLVRSKVAVLPALKVVKSCLLLLAALSGLLDTFCTVASLKVPVIIVYDVATKVLGT